MTCTIVNIQVDILFGESKARRDLLVRFFARPGLERHVRELARETGWSPTIIGRELNSLERAGILRSERIGNLRRYSVDANSPVATEIRSLVQKTIGIEARLRGALREIPGVEEAFLYELVKDVTWLLSELERRLGGVEPPLVLRDR